MSSEDKDQARRAANFSVLASQRDWVISGVSRCDIRYAENDGLQRNQGLEEGRRCC